MTRSSTLPALRERACPSCGSRESALEVTSGGEVERQTLDALRPYWFGIDKERRFFPYHRCAGCGLLYNRIFFDGAQLAELYGAMPPNMDLVPDEAIIATQRGYFAEAAARVELGGDYLEIGPDVGHLVRAARETKRFGRFWLFEPNRAVHGRLRATAPGATILPGMDDLSPVPSGSVGLAVMVHVLDHLLDPIALLAEIRRTLHPAGTLMIVTHDESSLLRRLLGRRWPAFCLQHPELYNPATIRDLLARAGLETMTVTRSANHFPVDFLARQAAQAAGVRLGRLPLPKRAVKLRLGNMLTLAHADQAAAAFRVPAESAA
ncbi:class I SAM-dependent methyltransferase [Sphingomonas sp.]|jgi:SAM-dependent methyltransferase|uniref:class I SAM-dependent methyltransferase n=1 Tax=Sphingomonas sp. TaxID=28214 RepID=UPI00260E11CD|nr:class I SAM-dependent methyltransferase [Sphingomonas sp.]MDF2603658.1 methyltransferase type 12 [Sphingomonas sp.]